MSNIDRNKQIIKNVALLGGSLGALKASKNLLLGRKELYHGTSMDNWDKIKDEGLVASRGGKGGASEFLQNKDFINNSKGKIHLTTNKSTAGFYANMNNKEQVKHRNAMVELKDKINKADNPIDKSILSTCWREMNYELGEMSLAGHLNAKRGIVDPNGKLITVNVGYNKFKNMKEDPEDIDVYLSESDISPSEILDSSAKTSDRVKRVLKDIPGYAIKHPIRFGTGVALAGAGTHGIGTAYKNLKLASEIVDDTLGRG